jgi:N-acetylglucosamine kinase-like BadF-type ATPase
MQNRAAAPERALGLGIDAGGTRTRWALAARDGAIVAEGRVAGLSALQMGSAAGRATVHANFALLAREVMQHGRPGRVRAGLTGFGGDGAQLQRWLAELLGLGAPAVALCSDIEIAYLASLRPARLPVYGTGRSAPDRRRQPVPPGRRARVVLERRRWRF